MPSSRATAGGLEELMTIDEVSAVTKVPRSTLYAWRHQGKGPLAVKCGKHLRYRSADVRSWLDSLAAAELSRGFGGRAA